MSTSSNNNIFTLNQVLIKLRNVVARDFAAPLWIKAEMLKLNRYAASGHAFPELVEKTNDKIVAKCQSIIWADDLRRISANFKDVTGKNFEDGIEILFYAELRFHELYGLRLRIIDVDAQYTLGKIALERKKTILRLQNEGLFYLNKNTFLSEIPSKLAVISVSTSRGLKDFENIIYSEGAIFKIETTLFPAVLQGSKCVETISNRISQISKMKDKFDAVLILRGGGDETGLDCYDDYNLAKAVCQCPIPVITGIGHSTNETVTELVAFANKITPTDVGYFIVKMFSTQLLKLQDKASQISALFLMSLANHEQLLEDIAASIYEKTKVKFQFQKEYLQSRLLFLLKKSIFTTSDLSAKLHNYIADINLKSATFLAKKNYNLNLQQKDLTQNLKHFFQKNNSNLKIFENNIAISNPSNLLKKGYSITLLDSKIIRNSKKLKDGDVIETIFNDGKVKSVIQKQKK